MYEPPGIFYCAFVIYTFRVFVVSYGTDPQYATTQPANSEDVIGQYLLPNEEQCHRLCWYRRLCTSYSYHTQLTPSSNYNCILHTDSVKTTTAMPTTLSGGWVEKQATGSNIDNGCKGRPCSDADVCVPTSSSLTSHVCLPLRCGIPEPVSHGNVTFNGTSPGDVAHVTCDEGYVSSPKGVSVEIVCLVTSRWTPFVGACRQYEFVTNTTKLTFFPLPWKVEPTSNICVKGIFNGSVFTSIRSTHWTLRIACRDYKESDRNILLWKVKGNESWSERVILDYEPVLPGDSFNMTIRMLSDTLHLVLNEAHTYPIPLADIKDSSGKQLDFSQSVNFTVNHMRSYVNLIAGC